MKGKLVGREHWSGGWKIMRLLRRSTCNSRSVSSTITIEQGSDVSDESLRQEYRSEMGHTVGPIPSTEPRSGNEISGQSRGVWLACQGSTLCRRFMGSNRCLRHRPGHEDGVRT